MLNVGQIEEGFVLDHIQAGKSLAIYHLLQLDKLDYTVAIIKNARSNKLGKKDILKIECDITKVDLDVLALIDKNITINVIKNGEIIDKKELSLPKEIKNIIQCAAVALKAQKHINQNSLMSLGTQRTAHLCARRQRNRSLSREATC